MRSLVVSPSLGWGCVVALFELNTDGHSIEINSSVAIALADPLVQIMIVALLNLDKVSGLASMTLTETATPKIHEFVLEANDGRIWTQLFDLRDVKDAFTFDVPDFWTTTEFAVNRPVRESTIAIARKFLTSSIEVNW